MSDAERPDGTDPRVLVPDDDEPIVTIVGAERSSSSAYHTHPEACDKINRSTTSREVKQSVAEWQDNDLCERCAELDALPDAPLTLTDTDVPDDARQIPASVCAAFRRAVGCGYPARDAGRVAGVSRSAVYPHVRGECDHDVVEPAFEYDGDGWVIRDE